jgi:RNA polymerase sigma factor (sigma-70 family)
LEGLQCPSSNGTSRFASSSGQRIFGNFFLKLRLNVNPFTLFEVASWENIGDLLREYQNDGDPALAEEIIETIGPDLSRFIRSRIPTDSPKNHAWEDAVQETFIAIAETLGAFDGSNIQSFRRWCFTVAKNKVRDQFRGTKVEVNTIVDPELLWEALSALRSKELSPEDSADLDHAISLLRASDAPCVGFLWDRYVVGLEFALLGDLYEITEDAATKRVQRCLALAKTLVRDRKELPHA